MLGVHFAITAEQEKILLDADGDDDAVSEIMSDFEEEWADDAFQVETDKAWDAIHRCLTDGSLDPDGGTRPLALTVVGGRHLHDEIYVVHVTAAQTREVAAALLDIDEPWLRARFAGFDDDYDGAADDQDMAYTWSNFIDVRSFFQRAAAAGRAVVFTAM
ncbi:DUF1877 family protein [Actinoplanes subglobosus]|uniref:DUF1877 family protein n=1 Tax=Actinoplanes subglobosus TaxID=1547892 RepID=A0ABV8IVL8_9ACTN